MNSSPAFGFSFPSLFHVSTKTNRLMKIFQAINSFYSITPLARISIAATLLVTLVASPNLVAQEVPGRAQKGPILIQGGTLHPIDGPAIENGSLLFENGKITAIGTDIEAPEGTAKLNAEGRHIYPGLFESHSQIGLTELAAVRATNDFRESGSINPNVKALVSVYPDNVNIPVTRSNGVLFALTAPSGGLISGKSAVIQLDGWTYEDLCVRAEAALQVSWPRQSVSGRRRARMSKKEIAEALKNQQAQMRKMNEFFEATRNYREARNADESTQPYDARLEAMIDVVDGKLPMMVQANGAAEIQSAVNFSIQQKVKLIILGGYDADECAALLKEHDVPVIIGAVHRMPQRRSDEYDRAYTLASRLKKAGVKFCISGTERSETWNARNLAYHAATAVTFGLSPDEAIRSITLSPAEILGVDDRIGSLTVGKEASLIITDGNPLDIRTNVLGAFIQGRAVDLSNRQKRLYQKYQQKYE